MSQLNNLVNEYNNLFALSNFSIPSTSLGCINPLKDEYIKPTNNFLFDNFKSFGSLQTPQYYNDKMTEVFDQINEILIKRESFSTISEYANNVAKLKDTQATYKFVNDKNNTSNTVLQNSSINLMKWLFIFFFVLSIVFQLFESMTLKSISIVSFVASIIILLNIFKILTPFVFAILLLSLFSLLVIVLFFYKFYISSLVILLFGAIGCNFYMNY